MRTAMLLGLGLGLVLVPLPADAQEARKDLNGFHFCIGSNMTLRENAAGTYDLTIFIDIPGDLSKAVFPGGKPILGQNDAFKPIINTGYKAAIGKDGKPMGRPQPFSVSVSLGRFIAGRPEPIESLSLEIRTAGLALPPMPVDAVAYSVAVPEGKITTPDAKTDDTNVLRDATTIGNYVRAVENGESSVALLQNGSEIARIPFPASDIRSQAQTKFTWVEAAAKALGARKACS